MKKKKQTKMTEDKKFLRSLYWVTNVLKRYFEGNLTKDEEQSVEKQLQSIDRLSDATEVRLTKNQLSKSDHKIKKQVFHTLNLIEPENEAEKATPKTPKRKMPFTVPFRKYAAVAAVFALVFGLSYFLLIDEHSFLKNNFTQSVQNRTIVLQTGASEIKELVLPDGTKLYANGGTRIDYDKKQYNKKQREVWLTGEAFFEVAKNPEKPFIIHTGNMQTTVRGTSFNVKAYPQLAENVVSVRTGKVQISQQGKQLAMLTPNEQIIYHTQNNRFETGVADGENAAGWRNGRLILNSANAEELKLRLKQQYRVDLVIQDKALKDIMLNSSFAKGTSLNEVMHTIATFYNVKYYITSSGQVVLSK